MQRLFSMFPCGAPGVALVLLRLTAAVSLVLSLDVLAHPGATPWTIAAAAVPVLALALGLLTPWAALLDIALTFAGVLHGTAAGPLLLGFSLVNALMVLLLGPGAYSIDARLFGRRVIELPPRR